MTNEPTPFLPTEFEISTLSASKTSAICFLESPVASAILVKIWTLVSGFYVLAAAFAMR